MMVMVMMMMMILPSHVVQCAVTTLTLIFL